MAAEMRSPVSPQTITIKASGCVPEMSVRGTVTQVRVDTETRLGCITNSCLKPVPIRPIIVKTLTIQFTDGIIMAPDSETRAGKQKKKKSSIPPPPPKRQH